MRYSLGLKFFGLLLVLVLMAGLAQAQSVVLPPPSPTDAPGPVVPLYALTQQDPAVSAFFNKRATLRADDYEGMYQLAVASLVCPISSPMGPPLKLAEQVVTGARALLRLAAEHGHAEAQAALGKNLLEGRCGASTDYVEGYAWLKTAGETKDTLADSNALSYYLQRMAPDIAQKAEYQAYTYTQHFSKPFSVAALVVPEMACPDPKEQAGVYLSGGDFDLAKDAVRTYVGQGYPTTTQEVLLPGGCRQLRSLNRFLVRLTDKATISEVNAFLEDKKFCIAAMAPLDQMQSANKANIILVSADLPETATANDQLLQTLQQSQLFSVVNPSQTPVAGSSACAQSAR